MRFLKTGLFPLSFRFVSIKRRCCTSPVCACIHRRFELVQGRNRDDGRECWVALASSDYARELLAKKPVSVYGKYNPQTQEYLQSLLPTMMEQVMSLLPAMGADNLPQPCFSAMQRWGAGFVANPIGTPVLSSSENNFVACGDFCLGSTFENAALSGMQAAAHLQNTLAPTESPLAARL